MPSEENTPKSNSQSTPIVNLIYVPEGFRVVTRSRKRRRGPVLAFRSAAQLPANWPKTEPIPRSMQEALALGWQIDGNSGEEMSADERIETGYVDLTKDVGMVGLVLRIPFRAEFSYGKPYSAEALISVPDEAVRS